MSDLLEIKNLSVSFRTPQGEVEAVRDVSLSLHPGEVLAIVGESGCGKSVLCRAIMKLLPRDGWIKGGTILAEVIEWPGEIDESRAVAAKERAEGRLQDKTPDTDIARAETALQRAIVRIQTLK